MLMDQTITAIIQWLAPILSTVIIAAATASINAQVQRSQRTADERHAETEAKRKAEAEWRDAVTASLDALTDATQTTMRATLLHYIEKYLTRGWLTPEERAALLDMHHKYSALNANGLIDGYMERIAQLPDREI